jgi:hypothetical protein
LSKAYGGPVMLKKKKPKSTAKDTVWELWDSNEVFSVRGICLMSRIIGSLGKSLHNLLDVLSHVKQNPIKSGKGLTA